MRALFYFVLPRPFARATAHRTDTTPRLPDWRSRAAATENVVIRGTDMRKPLTHARLAKFIQKDFDLTPWGIGVGDRVAIVLPNGPEVVVVALACSHARAPVPRRPAVLRGVCVSRGDNGDAAAASHAIARD